MTTPDPGPWPSFRPIIEFAREARGDQFAEELQGALLAARNAGWRWQNALGRATTLITDADAAGRDLLHLIRRVSAYRPAADGPPAAYTEIRRATEGRRRDGAA